MQLNDLPNQLQPKPDAPTWVTEKRPRLAAVTHPIDFFGRNALAIVADLQAVVHFPSFETDGNGAAGLRIFQCR